MLAALERRFRPELMAFCMWRQLLPRKIAEFLYREAVTEVHILRRDNDLIDRLFVRNYDGRSNRNLATPELRGWCSANVKGAWGIVVDIYDNSRDYSCTSLWFARPEDAVLFRMFWL